MILFPALSYFPPIFKKGDFKKLPVTMPLTSTGQLGQAYKFYPREIHITLPAMLDMIRARPKNTLWAGSHLSAITGVIGRFKSLAF